MNKPHIIGRLRQGAGFSANLRRAKGQDRLADHAQASPRPNDRTLSPLTVHESAVRRARAVVRLLRHDTPLVWRVAAHGAVLVLSAGVLLVSRIPTGAEASGGRNPTTLAGLVSQSARALAPDPVLSTSPASTDPEDPNADLPGFISTGAVAEADPSLLPWDEPQRYVVQEGDTVSGIAAQFGREPETLLYANPSIRENPHSLSIGDEITILPVDGVLHVVEEGDTIASIADSYGAKSSDIVGYTPNGLQSPDDTLVTGAEVVVPGGTMDITIPPLIQQVRGPAGGSSWAPSPNYGGPLVGTGNFHIAAYGRITQWFSSWHPAVDIANNYGTPIYAIDSGSIEIAGWDGWAGNAVVIDHGNGYESLYAHMQSVGVAPGQTVQRGQIIGTIGCTRGVGGRCTGPHLHIETYYNGARINPCSLGVCP